MQLPFIRRYVSRRGVPSARPICIKLRVSSGIQRLFPVILSEAKDHSPQYQTRGKAYCLELILRFAQDDRHIGALSPDRLLLDCV